jgi:3-oxoacyl-[acyl-carrier protein] reductase
MGFLIIKSLLPLLKQSAAGRIINTASGCFFDPPSGQAHYVAAKAGIIGLTRALQYRQKLQGFAETTVINY